MQERADFQAESSQKKDQLDGVAGQIRGGRSAARVNTGTIADRSHGLGR